VLSDEGEDARVLHGTVTCIVFVPSTRELATRPVSSAAAAGQLCRVQPQQVALPTAEPCALSVAEYQLPLLACTSPGTVLALCQVTSPVNHITLHI